MFTIVTNSQLKLLRVKLKGFFTVEEVGAFAAAAQKAVADMGCSSGDWLHSCDIGEMALQTQQVAEMFGQFINHPERRSRKLAIITGRSPVRMQIRRLMTRQDAVLFDLQSDADAWLLGHAHHRLSA